MIKVAAVLGVLLVGAAFALKDQIYKSGLKDAALKHVAAAAERSIKSERIAGKSLAASKEAQAEGVADVAALRRRAEAAAAEASAARAKLAAIEKGGDCPSPPEPKTCPADRKLVQP